MCVVFQGERLVTGRYGVTPSGYRHKHCRYPPLQSTSVNTFVLVSRRERRIDFDLNVNWSFVVISTFVWVSLPYNTIFPPLWTRWFSLKKKILLLCYIFYPLVSRSFCFFLLESMSEKRFRMFRSSMRDRVLRSPLDIKILFQTKEELDQIHLKTINVSFSYFFT